MSAAGKITQDLPPPGGYKPIYFKRVPTPTFLKGWQWIAGYFAVSTTALYLYYLNYKQLHIWDVEMRSSKFVVYPLLLAERDREFLKQLRRNRDEEARLMKNVEGWKVGTYYGEPIFKTLPQGSWLEPSIQEFYTHSHPSFFDDRAFIKHRT